MKKLFVCFLLVIGASFPPYDYEDAWLPNSIRDYVVKYIKKEYFWKPNWCFMVEINWLNDSFNNDKWFVVILVNSDATGFNCFGLIME